MHERRNGREDRTRRPRAWPSFALLTIGAAFTACVSLKSGSDVLIDDGAGTDASDDRGNDASDAADANTDQEASSPVPVPIAVDAQHLRLWLTADRGVACDAGGRVQRWADQSGRQDDARPMQGQLGPQCYQPGSPHVIHDIGVPYFSAPTANHNIIDETLDVDLTFLTGTNYTILVVERRWQDDPPWSYALANEFIGTTSPFVDAGTRTQTDLCTKIGDFSALSFGYVYGRDTPQLVLNEGCSGEAAPPSPPVPNPPPANVSYEVAQLDMQLGSTIWMNGQLAIREPNGKQPLFFAVSGAIGRALVATSNWLDWRFHGDIAEVIVYDSAIGDTQRTTLDAYVKAHWGL